MDNDIFDQIEPQNLTMRMQMRKFTCLANVFSKKLENLEAALALDVFDNNFKRIHLGVSAMEAKVSRHLWAWEEFFRINEQREAA